MSYEKAPIIATLARIQNGELVLPAIQRDFVWEPERMYKLLDSIFRGYPFSTLLFWNTKQRIQYREFTKEWKSDLRYTFQVKEEGKKGTMVLDGQQRLQTLYLALHGSYQQKILYFDLLSGIDPDDISQAMYHFEYLVPAEAEERNNANKGHQLWIPLRDLTNLNHAQIVTRSISYLQKATIDVESDAGRRLSSNVGRAYGVLKGDSTLNYFTVDKEFGDDGVVTDLDEILEIFVRVNSGGQVLSKSDLMFSLMQMLWEGAADAISDLIENLNRKGRYDFDKDFILKCALVCCGKGAKYEVSKLRDEATVHLIQEKFPQISQALENLMDFVINHAKIIDDRILRSYNTLIPFVYFYYQQPGQAVRGEETMLRMKRALYLALMTSLYSRYADNYIDLTRNIFDLAQKEKPGQFPLEAYTRFVFEKTGSDQFTDGLLQANVMLVMNILEGGRRLPEGKRARPPEIDHIFPKSKLESLGVPEEQRNHFANFRLIQPMDNNWKRAQDPAPYFQANPGALKYYLIPAEYLTYEQYLLFLENRRAKIWDRVNQFFGLSEASESPNNEPVVASQSIVEQSTQTSAPASALYQDCLALLTPDEQAHPILQDQSQWVDVFQSMGYSPQWAGRSHWALVQVGIKSVADFAVAIMALKLKPNGWSSDRQRYTFANPTPDGKVLNIVTREFGGWAWDYALTAIEKRGLNWKQYLVS